MGHHYDGIIGRITPRILEACRAAGIPLVNTWLNSPVADSLPGVFADFRASGRIATEHLYARGLRSFVHIGVQGDLASRLHREGMAAVAEANGCELRRLAVAADLESTAAKWARFVNRVRKLADWPLPLGVTVMDNVARPLVFELGRMGLNVPGDIAIVAWENDPTYCTRLFPTLSSVDPGYIRIGYEAACLLAGLMRGDSHTARTQLLPPRELVVRDSSDSFAVSDSRVAAALRFMGQHSERPISVPEVAEAAGISQQNLNKLFHRHVGHTVNTELIRLRVEHFKRLLVESDRPVKELYRLSGFGTESLAYPTFKRLTGQTPLQYRAARRLQQH